MVAKYGNDSGKVASKSLSKITSGSSENDFVTDGLIARIVEESNKGYYDLKLGENAIYVIMEVCAFKNGRIRPTGAAVQVYISMFDRVAAPYTIDYKGEVVRDRTKNIVRASGSVVDTWKCAANAEAFMIANKHRAMKFTLDAIVEVRAWDRASNSFSTTKTREQKVYKIDWV